MAYQSRTASDASAESVSDRASASVVGGPDVERALVGVVGPERRQAVGVLGRVAAAVGVREVA